MWLVNGISSWYKSLRPHYQQSPSHISTSPFNTAMNIFNSSVFTICLNSIALSESWRWKKKQETINKTKKESQIFRGEDGNIFFCSGEDCKSFSTWLKSKRKYTYPHSKQSFKWKVSFSQKSEFYLNHSNFKQSTGSLQRFGYSCKAVKNALGFRFWQSTKADSFIWKYNFQWKKKDS